MSENLIWLGIVFCVSQSAIFSGLNIAFFSLSRMRLQVEAENGVIAAKKVLSLRQDANFLLVTILWGNIGINVLLALLSNSILTGVTAFIFSTVIITIFGEICPQAYFSRNAMRMASKMVPLVRIYQLLLYPIAKPSALLLDAWLGEERINYFREIDLKGVIHAHIEAEGAGVDQLEGLGAINFLTIDDIAVGEEGEVLDIKSIIVLPEKVGFPVFPKYNRCASDPFLKKINASQKSWVVITNKTDDPLVVIDANNFIRDALMLNAEVVNIVNYCHRPIIAKSKEALLGSLIYQLKINSHDNKHQDGVISKDVILLWSDEKRIITGADILGRLLKGVTSKE